jgi:hypothetical protein
VEDGQKIVTSGSVLRQARRWIEEMESLKTWRGRLVESAKKVVSGDASEISGRTISECLRTLSLVGSDKETWDEVLKLAIGAVERAGEGLNVEDILMMLQALPKSPQSEMERTLRSRLEELGEVKMKTMDGKQHRRWRSVTEVEIGAKCGSDGRMSGKEAAGRAIRAGKEYKREGYETEKETAEMKILKKWVLDSEEGREASSEQVSTVVRFLAAVKEDTRPERQLFALVSERIKASEDVEVVCSLMWSLGRMRSRDGLEDEVVEHAVDVILENLDKVSEKSLTGCLYSFGKLGVWSPRLASGISWRAIEMLHTMKGCDLSSLIWGYAVSDELNEELTMAVAKEVYRRLTGAESGELEPPTVYLNDKDTFVCLWSLQTLLDELPEKLRRFYKKKTDSLLSNISNSSEAHRDLSRRLSSLGVRHVNEHVVTTPAGPLVVDIGLPDRSVAVEVDGPWHTVRLIGRGEEEEKTTRLDGPTAWKRRMLGEAEWKVMSITTKEFEMQKDKNLFMRKKLQEMMHMMTAAKM